MDHLPFTGRKVDGIAEPDDISKRVAEVDLESPGVGRIHADHADINKIEGGK